MNKLIQWLRNSYNTGTALGLGTIALVGMFIAAAQGGNIHLEDALLVPGLAIVSASFFISAALMQSSREK